MALTALTTLGLSGEPVREASSSSPSRGPINSSSQQAFLNVVDGVESMPPSPPTLEPLRGGRVVRNAPPNQIGCYGRPADVTGRGGKYAGITFIPGLRGRPFRRSSRSGCSGWSGRPDARALGLARGWAATPPTAYGHRP